MLSLISLGTRSISGSTFSEITTARCRLGEARRNGCEELPSPEPLNRCSVESEFNLCFNVLTVYIGKLALMVNDR